ncbi:histone-lysine N-methyltransferase, H3 lysine-9 specific SUVH5-like [Chenopodium quinoa]|uniref:YDG domain-containing protein n=1 Tax=Chenopodium quinoa TaxID=63459 RepID=A0A803LUI1_CHEQI|nr:histone-lysine N-methyltransferase, H3 lysine-9 specific SUVH5-like [Chenopodium quinoa]
MQFHQDFPDGCDSATSSVKKPFFETSSFPSPESFKWWRKASATKSKPNSSEKVKKTPFLVREISGEDLKIKGNVYDGKKPRCNPYFDEKSKNTHFPKMETKSGNSKVKENVDDSEVQPKCDEKSKKSPLLGKEDEGERTRVLATLKIFREKCKEISQSKDAISKKRNRIDFRAKEELRKEGKLRICSSKILGSVPGVKVGDRFEYRVEINVVGLHGRVQHGIDYMEYLNRSLATCIVAKEGYSDKMSDYEVITYMGEGGIVKNKEGVFFTDQKLTRGNLALKNSMIAKTEVRVIRGLKIAAKFGNWRNETFTYVYDGLYRVVSYQKKVGPSKNMVFEFKLKRCPGQAIVPWFKFKNS